MPQSLQLVDIFQLLFIFINSTPAAWPLVDQVHQHMHRLPDARPRAVQELHHPHRPRLGLQQLVRDEVKLVPGRDVLYCTVLYCTDLVSMYCTVLCCTDLFCTVVYCTDLVSMYWSSTKLTPNMRPHSRRSSHAASTCSRLRPWPPALAPSSLATAALNAAQ